MYVSMFVSVLMGVCACLFALLSEALRISQPILDAGDPSRSPSEAQALLQGLSDSYEIAVTHGILPLKGDHPSL